MVGEFETLEQVTIVAPLGIRFWDVALGVSVDDGLTVTAWPQGMPDMATRAFQTPSGIYAFRNLPGLHAVEYPLAGGPDSSPPAARRFTVEVVDTRGRFLPAAFGVDLPFRGIFPRGFTGGGPPGFYLFSAPTRPPTASLAVIRAQLMDGVNPGAQKAAAYAVMEVAVPGAGPCIGVADERGCLAVLFPYPTFGASAQGASPGPSPRGISQQRWEVAIGVRYAPAALTSLQGSSVPDLRSILNQSPGLIWTTLAVPAGQPVDRMSAELVFGQALVLRTDQRSALTIGPAASP